MSDQLDLQMQDEKENGGLAITVTPPTPIPTSPATSFASPTPTSRWNHSADASIGMNKPSPLPSPTTPHSHRPTKANPIVVHIATPSSNGISSAEDGSSHKKMSTVERRILAASGSHTKERSSASEKDSESNNNNANGSNPQRIQVSIRIRPLNADELSSGERHVWHAHQQSGAMIEELQQPPTSSLSHDASANTPSSPLAPSSSTPSMPKQYQFDYIAPSDESTSSFYKAMVRRLVLKACVGYHANVFAYGQTASGKTHTVIGNEFSPGILLLAIGDIFHYIAQTPNRQFLLRVSCIEIYNEEINDLLAPEGQGLNLKLEDISESTQSSSSSTSSAASTSTSVSNVKIRGLTQEFVRAPADFISLLLRAEERRAVAATDANERSSRSHTMFRIHIESRMRIPSSSSNANATDTTAQSISAPSTTTTTSAAPRKIRSSLLTFIDLAGSECINQLGSSFERRQECRFINRSLLGLGRVIKSLSEGGEEAGIHVPWRDGKLTRVCRPALGGNAYTLFICCIAPGYQCRDESLNTLRFGCFANRVLLNEARINVKEERTRAAIDQTLVQDMEKLRAKSELDRMEIERLRERLRKLQMELDTQAAESAKEVARLRAHLEKQKLLGSLDDNAAASTAEAPSTPAQSSSNNDDDPSEIARAQAEVDALRLKLRIAEEQIRVLEEKMIPMMDDAKHGANEEREKYDRQLSDLKAALSSLRESNQQLAVARAEDGHNFEIERRRMERERDTLLKAMLEDKVVEVAKVESRLLREQRALQSSRLLALQSGLEVLKVCARKSKVHPVRIWIPLLSSAGDDLVPSIHWRKSAAGWFGRGGSGASTNQVDVHATEAITAAVPAKSSSSNDRFIFLRDVEVLKLGQATPAFDRNALRVRSTSALNRSLSFVTPRRTLDLIFASVECLEMVVAALRGSMGSGSGSVRIEDHRPIANKKKQQQQNHAAAQQQVSSSATIDHAAAAPTAINSPTSFHSSSASAAAVKHDSTIPMTS